MTSRQSPWVVMGPAPLFGHCERCGETISRPSPGITLDGLIRYLEDAMERHADCTEAQA